MYIKTKENIYNFDHIAKVRIEPIEDIEGKTIRYSLAFYYDNQYPRSASVMSNPSREPIEKVFNRIYEGLAAGVNVLVFDE